MSDLASVLTGSLVTILIGVGAYAIHKLVLDPLGNFRKEIQDVGFNLSYHGPTIHTPIGRTKETSDAAEKALRKNSSELEAQLHAMPWYTAARIVTFSRLPLRKDVEQASVTLRGLVTYLHQTGEKAAASVDEVTRRVERIKKLLKLKPIE
jgi:hypothetical protein